MEERTLQRNEQEGPTTVVEAPSPPQVPFSDDDAPALYSGDESDEEEFEFPFVSRDSPAGTAAPADELFADGRIRPFYPVFGCGGGVDGHDGAAQTSPAAPRIRGQLGRLFLEESRARNSSTSSMASSATTEDDGGDLEGAPPESYCLWTPGSSSSAPASSPRPPRKSSSTGSMARWRRISELVVGRSHSDGKEKFLFLPTPLHEAPNKGNNPKPKPSPAAGGRKPSLATATEIDTVTAAHRIAYITKGGGGGVPGGTPRRTFLPYREELVGFFANVNGISRSHHHPF